MENWQTTSLEKVVKFIDYRGRTPQKTESGLRLITAKNVKMGYLQSKPMEFVDPGIYDTWMTRGIPRKGDVLFTTEAPLGNVAQLDTDEKVVFAQRIIVMQPDREVLDSTFLKYMLLSSFMQKRIHEKGTGATVQGIKAQLLKKVQISFPKSLREQKRIVAIADQAFEGIDRAIANTEKNLTNAHELFESYLNSQLLAVASSNPTQTLLCITDLIVDCEHKTAPTQETGIPSIRTPNVGKGYLIFDNVNRVSEETYELWTRRAKPHPGDLILAREAPAGNVGVIPEGQKVCLGQRTVLIRPKKGIANSQYLAFLLLHPIMQTRILAHSTGATVQHVNMKDIRELSISDLPPIQAQTACVRELEQVKAQVNRLESIYQQKLTALDELKQSILQKAFTGELTADTTNQATEAVKEVVAA